MNNEDLILDNERLRNELRIEKSEKESLKQEIENMKNGFLATQLYSELLNKSREETIKQSLENDDINISFYLSQSLKNLDKVIGMKINGKIFILQFKNAQGLIHEVSKLLLKFGYEKFGCKPLSLPLCYHIQKEYDKINSELERIFLNDN